MYSTAETWQKECRVYRLDFLAEQGTLEAKETACYREHCSARLRLLDGIVEIVTGSCNLINHAGCDDVVFTRPTSVDIDQLT